MEREEGNGQIDECLPLKDGSAWAVKQPGRQPGCLAVVEPVGQHLEETIDDAQVTPNSAERCNQKSGEAGKDQFQAKGRSRAASAQGDDRMGERVGGK